MSEEKTTSQPESPEPTGEEARAAAGAAVSAGETTQAETNTATAGTGRVAELEHRVEELEQALAKERDAATDYMGRWQRAQADFANFRRRQQQEQEQMRRVFAT